MQQPPELAETNYPLVTHVSGGDVPGAEVSVDTRGEVKRHVRVELVHDEAGVIQKILQASQRGQCVCWVRNTVADAMASFKLLKGEVREKLMLFHARYALGDRFKIENDVIETFGTKNGARERPGKVLIATQVVEQSLDLDFDYMVSDLAPIDRLIQRAGRVHRHVRDVSGNRLEGEGAKDQRGEVVIAVFSPAIVEKPQESWFKAVFKAAAYVYPDHGQLWRTARLLEKKGGWNMPEDARNLIEGVFGDKAEAIPEALQGRHIRAVGKNSAEKSLAHSNVLQLEDGYRVTPMHWLDETLAPTRLGEASTVVRLACWDGANLEPWFKDKEFPWEMSQLSIRETLIKSEAVGLDPSLQEAVAMLKETLPDKGKWSVLVVLRKLESEVWQGTAQDMEGGTVVVSYDRVRGLRVEQ